MRTLSWQFFLKKSNHTISSRISSNFEAFASELLENIDKMFPRYHIHSDKYNMLECPTT